MRARAREPVRISSIGRVKLAVFPVPVCARRVRHGPSARPELPVPGYRGWMAIAHLCDGAKHRLRQAEIGKQRARSLFQAGTSGRVAATGASSIGSAGAVVVSFKSGPVAGWWPHCGATPARDRREDGMPRVTRPGIRSKLLKVKRNAPRLESPAQTAGMPAPRSLLEHDGLRSCAMINRVFRALRARACHRGVRGRPGRTAPQPAVARVWVGFGFPLYVGPPAYYPPPVLLSAACLLSAAGILPSTGLRLRASLPSISAPASCVVAGMVCAMEHPVTPGSSCYCTTAQGRAWGRAT